VNYKETYWFYVGVYSVYIYMQTITHSNHWQ